MTLQLTSSALQTFLAPYSGDQFLSTVQRILGTALGLVWGMGESGPRHSAPRSAKTDARIAYAVIVRLVPSETARFRG